MFMTTKIIKKIFHKDKLNLKMKIKLKMIKL